MTDHLVPRAPFRIGLDEPIGAASDTFTAEQLNDRPNERGECFYCHATVGEPHGHTCVLRNRLVHARVTIDLLMPVWASADREHLEFAWNDGTWCSDNLIFDIHKTIEAHETPHVSGGHGPCMCPSMIVEYVGEAQESAQGT